MFWFTFTKEQNTVVLTELPPPWTLLAPACLCEHRTWVPGEGLGWASGCCVSLQSWLCSQHTRSWEPECCDPCAAWLCPSQHAGHPVEKAFGRVCGSADSNRIVRAGISKCGEVKHQVPPWHFLVSLPQPPKLLRTAGSTGAIYPLAFKLQAIFPIKFPFFFFTRC